MGIYLHENKMIKNLHKIKECKQSKKGVSTFKDILNFWNKEFKNVQMKTKDSYQNMQTFEHLLIHKSRI